MLARELGYTVRELLARVSSYELTEWVALYRIEAEERDQRKRENQAQNLGTKWRR